MRRLSLLLATALLAAVAAAPSTSSAATQRTAVGIGDQSGSIFTQPNFRALKIKKVRYFIRWNTARNRGELQRADDYVAAARRARVKVLMHISTNDLRPKRAKLPSVAQYKRDVGKLVRRYKAKGVKEWGVWNEANHKTQPTWKSPKRAAQYFLAMRSMCKGCTIVALDVLDQAGDSRYIQRWFAAVGKKNRSKASVIGVHNYSDTNRFRSRGTARILKTVKKYNKRANFWLTETGGLAAFGRAFPCDLNRQNRSIRYMFTLVKKFRRDIDRLYSYNYFGTPEANCTGGDFDAGLVDEHGNARPAYNTFKRLARSYKR